MSADKVYRAIGLMSGTSLDGAIDVALVETDGQGVVKPLRFYAHPYDIEVRNKVRACFGKRQRDEALEEAEKLVTDLHIEAVKAFNEEADIIGFHGQTITHDPDNQFTWQLGDGARLAKSVGIDVVYNMRKADVESGGQGAPLLPLYHQALLSEHERPVAILNLGGVANITYIGADGELIAFDCGPANALMDDLMKVRRQKDFDEDGRLASSGNVLENVVSEFLSSPFFKKPPPKSLDRDHWTTDIVRYASAENAMATLLEMTVMGVTKSFEHLPENPHKVYVSGGGRKNSFLMDSMVERTDIPFVSIDELGWNGDATEAEGFAYLSVRSKLGLPITFPTTTGTPKPLTGGILVKAGS